jgi:hypothetical protein
MTQWARHMIVRRALLALLCLVPCFAQTAEEYRAYTEHPRLLLGAQRLRRLKRERDRQSMRWEQFNTLMTGHARMPEPGFSSALYYAITGEADAARQAIEWAATAPDVRQAALVFDWCQPTMPPAQVKVFAGKLSQATAALKGRNDPASMRDRAFAAIAIADQDAAASEAAMRDLIQNSWRKGVAPRLRSGALALDESQLFALIELLHAVRDNLNIDLREDARAWFKELAPLHLLSHYPSPYPAAENEYRIPAYDGEKPPDLNRAALSRATELAMVAYDTNAADTQFLQGWLIQDRYLLRSAFGITYEFLWANPYQPGLSYYHFPLAHHDPATGRIFIRSSWDDDATWFGKVGREWQLFRDGKITALDISRPREPIEIGDTVVFIGREPLKFEVKGMSRGYVIGLQPGTKYDVEVDDEQMREETTDVAGTLEIEFAPETTAGVRLHTRISGTQ